MSEQEVKVSFRVSDNGSLQVIDNAGRKLAEFAHQADAVGTRGASAFTKLGATIVSLNQGIQLARTAFDAVAGPIGKFINAAEESERATTMLAHALKGTGKYSDEYLARLLGMASGLERVTKASDDSIANIARQLVLYGAAEKDIARLTETVLDLAASTDKDLGGATMSVAKMIEGNFAPITRQLGLRLDDTASSAEKLAAVMESLQRRSGAARAEAQTFAGSIEQLANQSDNVSEALGRIVTESSTIRDIITDLTGSTSEMAAAIDDWTRANRELIDSGIDVFLRNILPTAIEALIPQLDVLRAAWGAVTGVMSGSKPIGVGLKPTGEAVNEPAWKPDIRKSAADAAAEEDRAKKAREDQQDREESRLKRLIQLEEARGKASLDILDAEIDRRETAMSIADKELMLAQQRGASYGELLSLAEQADAAERGVLEAQVAALDAQKAQVDAKIEALKAQDLSVVSAQAEADIRNEIAILEAERPAQVAKLNAEIERTNAALAMSGDRARELKASMTTMLDVGELMKNPSDAMKGALEDMLEKKFSFDMQISENFRVHIPGEIGLGLGLIEDLWSGSMGELGQQSQETANMMRQQFSGAFRGITSIAKGASDAVVGMFSGTGPMFGGKAAGMIGDELGTQFSGEGASAFVRGAGQTGMGGLGSSGAFSGTDKTMMLGGIVGSSMMQSGFDIAGADNNDQLGAGIGGLMQTLGGLAMMFPGYGTAIGAGLMLAGTAVSQPGMMDKIGGFFGQKSGGTGETKTRKKIQKLFKELGYDALPKGFQRSAIHLLMNEQWEKGDAAETLTKRMFGGEGDYLWAGNFFNTLADDEDRRLENAKIKQDIERDLAKAKTEEERKKILSREHNVNMLGGGREKRTYEEMSGLAFTTPSKIIFADNGVLANEGITFSGDAQAAFFDQLREAYPDRVNQINRIEDMMYGAGQPGVADTVPAKSMLLDRMIAGDKDTRIGYFTNSVQNYARAYGLDARDTTVMLQRMYESQGIDFGMAMSKLNEDATMEVIGAEQMKAEFTSLLSVLGDLPEAYDTTVIAMRNMHEVNDVMHIDMQDTLDDLDAVQAQLETVAATITDKFGSALTDIFTGDKTAAEALTTAVYESVYEGIMTGLVQGAIDAAKQRDAFTQMQMQIQYMAEGRGDPNELWKSSAAFAADLSASIEQSAQIAEVIQDAYSVTPTALRGLADSADQRLTEINVSRTKKPKRVDDLLAELDSAKAGYVSSMDPASKEKDLRKIQSISEELYDLSGTYAKGTGKERFLAQQASGGLEFVRDNAEWLADVQERHLATAIEQRNIQEEQLAAQRETNNLLQAIHTDGQSARNVILAPTEQGIYDRWVENSAENDLARRGWEGSGRREQQRNQSQRAQRDSVMRS